MDLLNQFRLQLTKPNLLRHANFWTMANEGRGPLHFIAPQTRLRIVDNSPYSSIAPSNPATSSTAGSKESGMKKKSDPVTKVGEKNSRMGPIASQFALPKPALCIRVYNKQNKGRIELPSTKAANELTRILPMLPSPDEDEAAGSIKHGNVCIYLTSDKVIVAVCGQKKKGWIVASRLPSQDGWPRFESNDIVLVDDEGNPLGTRILVPIPAKLKSLSGDINKILSIATTFV